mgnify:CR=1 FL=1
MRRLTLSSVGCSAPESDGYERVRPLAATIRARVCRRHGPASRHSTSTRVVFPAGPEQGGCLHLFVLFCGSRRLRSDGVRLRYQAPRRKRQREAEDSRRQIGPPAAGATTASNDAGSMPHTGPVTQMTSAWRQALWQRQLPSVPNRCGRTPRNIEADGPK